MDGVAECKPGNVHQAFLLNKMELLNPLNKWVPIRGKENFEIYYDGVMAKVRSKTRQIVSYHSKTGKYFIKTITGKEKKICFNARYFSVSLGNAQNDCDNRSLHSLIAQNYIPNPENKPCINHKNGIKSDVSITNLEWATYSENTMHAILTNLLPNGENHWKAHATKEQVILIRKMYKDGKSKEELMCFFKLKRNVIHNIVTRRYYKYIV